MLNDNDVLIDSLTVILVEFALIDRELLIETLSELLNDVLNESLTDKLTEVLLLKLPESDVLSDVEILVDVLND
nr:hypothetical protein [Macrococcus canis]